MAAQPNSDYRLRRGEYLGEISALCFLHVPSHLSPLPFLLSGTGFQLLLYNLESGELIRTFQVFEGVRVHGIVAEEPKLDTALVSSSTNIKFRIAVFGEKRVKLFELRISIELEMFVELVLVRSLTRFSQWVLDVLFLKVGSDEESGCLAIGCSDNSVRLYDISRCSVFVEVQSPEKCLLYSMRLWGDNLESLRLASGTIFNEIIVWKVVPQDGSPPSTGLLGDILHEGQQFEAANISRLIGHEGSIFRMAWALDGSKLVSVSDDRSVRIWAVKKDYINTQEVADVVLFGHCARVWDCCISGSLIVTAGEDCACRVWGLDGEQIKIIKEHIGRGVWRCLYDPSCSLIITAGFDSGIKVHKLPASLPRSSEEHGQPKQFIGCKETVIGRIPNSFEHVGLMDSKSEYVRCLRFISEDTLYVATNHGYLYHAKISDTQDIKWTRLTQVGEEVPIVCMDLLSKTLSKDAHGADDWIALGDGKGNMTITRVVGDYSKPRLDISFTWSAGKERQLLGAHWCKALGHGFIFTADPRGNLKLWRLCEPSLADSSNSLIPVGESLVAEFTSCFGIRIMCLNSAFGSEVLVCGDLRGNLVLFPLSKGLLVDAPIVSGTNISSLAYFKGAHGISSVTSISVANLSSTEIEIRSIGGDGCICYLEYDQVRQNLEFIGMKQVKELSLIQSVAVDNSAVVDDLAQCSYAIGFAFTDYIVWNLKSEAKVVQIPCGGWRRPHSYYLGDVPELKNCFAYVKDEVIYIHRQWIPESETKVYPQNLHIQFHGKEIHSLCHVYENELIEANSEHDVFDECSWVATGCEDGTVRLTRYISGTGSWSFSKLLGEHVGGSAVRSICCVSSVHVFSSYTDISPHENGDSSFAEHNEKPVLLISVGAKRVLTSWLLRDKRVQEKTKPLVEQEHRSTGNENMRGMASSITFKWLSTDMPSKSSIVRGRTKVVRESEVPEKVSLEKTMAESKPSSDDKQEDDWRYLAVTAFLVKCVGCRLTVCFIVVACSDATLALRALVLPLRLWFDVALLTPLSSPALALQHVTIPVLSSEGQTQIRNVYMVVSGATDGSIALWDLTDSIEAFLRQLSAQSVEKFINCQSRPRTGRGSQGGRWWKLLASGMSKQRSNSPLVKQEDGKRNYHNVTNHTAYESPITDYDVESTSTGRSLESVVNGTGLISEIHPLNVFRNFHQSGVNCLHVSYLKDHQRSDRSFMFTVISGGDDQALHYLKFKFSHLMDLGSESVTPSLTKPVVKSGDLGNPTQCGQSQSKNYRIKLVHHDAVASAHSSAVKGVWTDGTWVFSTGLDQRVRCWLFEENSKLNEKAQLIINVPEPEAMSARLCGGSRYDIAVAGRGMQMVEFYAS